MRIDFSPGSDETAHPTKNAVVMTRPAIRRRFFMAVPPSIRVSGTGGFDRRQARDEAASRQGHGGRVARTAGGEPPASCSCGGTGGGGSGSAGLLRLPAGLCCVQGNREDRPGL